MREATWSIASRILLTSMFAAQLMGCNDNEGGRDGKVVAVSRSRDLPQWLTVNSTIEPPIWLRSRETGHEVRASDPEVDRLRRALNQAAARFIEDPRMIANRTAQTVDMLAEMSQAELGVDVMTGMIDVADVTPHKQLYGEMCQHYLNIRKTGADRAAALEQLKTAAKQQNALR